MLVSAMLLWSCPLLALTQVAFWVQDSRLQKKSSLDAAQKEVAQLHKQLADLKADLQRTESTIEVCMHDCIMCVPLLLHLLIPTPCSAHDL